jgi:hypothetical protein
MDGPLLGPDPAQVRIARQGAPERALIGGDVGEAAPDDDRRQCLDGRDDDLGSAPDRERHTVAAQVAVGLEDDVGGGVVGRLVHGV